MLWEHDDNKRPRHRATTLQMIGVFRRTKATVPGAHKKKRRGEKTEAAGGV